MKKLNKVISVFLSALIIISALCCFSVSADTFVVDDVFKVRLESNTECMIAEYYGTDTTMVIPDTIVAKKVTGIIPSAFEGDDLVQYVVFPDTLEVIGCMAFAKSTALKEITIPSTVKTVVWSAFQQASALESVVFEEGQVTTITETCFYNCTSLKNVQLSNSITTIERYAFGECTSLENIFIPSSVTSIDKTAFKFNPQLTISCEKGSYAEQYCIDNGLNYEIVEQVIPVDKTELEATIATADEVLAKIDYYKPASVEGFQTAYDNAVDVFNNESVTEEDVANVISALLEAIAKVETYTLGDVDLNDTINIKDATRLQMYVARYTTFTDVQLWVADADQDGIVSITDATRVQMIVTKLI